MLQERVTKKLTDTTRNNPQLYYRDNRTTRVTLAPLGSNLIDALLAGQPLTKWEIAEECPHLLTAPPEATAPEAAAVEVEIPLIVPEAPSGEKLRGRRARSGTVNDPLTKRLRAMQSKARENAEERGIPTLFLAIGMMSWAAADGGRPPRAPLFFCPLAIERDPANRDDLLLRRPEESDITVNRSLLTAGPTIVCERIGEMFEDGVVDDVHAAYDAVAAALAGLPGIALESTTAIGIFNFAQMVMVEDLHAAGETIANHLVIRALAGDQEAQAELAGTREGSVGIDKLDEIPPAKEPFVLDADPWQRRTIQTILQDEESNATISGPPGTGKSQSIANLIAGLISQGKSVLFVCEKRAALDVVKRRLSTVGLGHLVLDVHGAETTRQRAYAQLREARRKHRDALPPDTEYDQQLIETRERLNAHDRFMHDVVPTIGMSLHRLLSEIAAFPPYPTTLRLTGSRLDAMTSSRLAALEGALREASREPTLFLPTAGTPWSGISFAPEDVPNVLARIAALVESVRTLRTALSKIGVAVSTRGELVVAAKRLREVRRLFTSCAPAVLDLDRATLTIARDTFASGIGVLMTVLPGPKKTAVMAARKHLLANSRSKCAELLTELLALEDPWRSHAGRVADLSAGVDAAADSIVAELGWADDALAVRLNENLGEAIAWGEACMRERDGAYRGARMGEIRAELAGAGLGELLRDLAAVPPADWPTIVRYIVLHSHLEPFRAQLSRVDGRTLDDVVVSFDRLEQRLRIISRDRVLRAAAERFISMTRESPQQFTNIELQIGKKTPRRPLRALYADAPAAMLAITPCVMASPISVSQFLPRQQMFDVLIADEASQLSPEAGITAIMRAKRVVLAGDEKQLPPTDFFQGTIDDDDDDEAMAIVGTESVLGALQPFCKDLDLRVHYRSRDERLIAFSNYHLYGNELITFPGAGGDVGLRFEYVPPSGAEHDEDSSSPEVLRVVALILEHAEQRPNESLGVIALGSPHARRIEAALFAARRERPELDTFFGVDSEEPFFVKNLERVQGDERDAIILTIGYGRTKTGSVSHNFGPINQEGGERRLNVAITRAKSRLTLVASFRKMHLNPSSLSSRGAALLAAYLGFVEGGGADLGRDGADIAVEPNAFERDIQRALEKRLGTTIIPQYGVGKFRIDLAVQHPDDPGRFIMAVECDGATYHSTPTARMRDRLRQSVLENLGWQFVRVWSTDWFNDRERELARIEAAYRMALAVEFATVPTQQSVPAVETTIEPTDPPQLMRGRIGSSPLPRHFTSIDDISDSTLRRLRDWIATDGRLRTNDELFEEMFRELGFERRGPRIKQRLLGVLR
jgi:very-short-patch-repair endonuclease